MSLVRFENVTKSFGGRPTLDKIAFRVEEGEKIGLIGRNGTGKSTVLRLITGELEADGGTVERMRRARVACLAQMPDLSMSDTILDTAMMPFQDLVAMEGELEALEHRMAAGDETVHDRDGELQELFSARGGYTFHTTVKRVLHGLGFRDEDYGLSVMALSGGQRTRLMLALILLQDADLLPLDEPENHLDLEAQDWLETFLLESPRAIVIITHDRRMLDHVVTRIVEVERGQLVSYSGNYEFFRTQKVLVRDQQQKAFERQQAFIDKELTWIERFRYKNTKADQVQSRILRLEKLERVEAPPPESSSAKFAFGEVVRSGQSFQVERGERIGIIGPNGSGKTTLLRHLAGRLPEGTGTVTPGHKVQLGFYQQHHESVNRANDIFTEIRLLRPDMTPERVRSFMGRFLFTGDDIFKSLSTLSGGEVSRVAIAKLILCGANVLLLDEPTNHLDIASRETIEGALDDFPGTLL
ncbi:MAG: ABC-F family ATP-binding cassette domain-containing protein, partial [Candidatus Hydrogenedentes bacterium]|nr:ABC-F family ATP-binding cassette domain-containing protein [Candidatus Hydrogenedentota bacterium]